MLFGMVGPHHPSCRGQFSGRQDSLLIFLAGSPLCSPSRSLSTDQSSDTCCGKTEKAVAGP